MKVKACILGIFSLLLMGCEGEEGNRNPYLQDVGFRVNLELYLPQYQPLTNTGSPVYVGLAGVGTRGIFVMNVGFDQYRAFEASCPNHAPNNCSTMEDEGQNASCGCEGYEYSLFTGQMLDRPNDGKNYFDMLEYRAVLNGDVVTVSN